MRVLAIGDIHGCANALDTLLAEIKLQPEDTLVTLGDYVDRGPDSKGVLDRLLELSEQYHLVSLRGNHEQMLLQACTDKKAKADWIENGGDATLSSYGSLVAITEAHWKFIEEQCVDCWESETHFLSTRVCILICRSWSNRAISCIGDGLSILSLTNPARLWFAVTPARRMGCLPPIPSPSALTPTFTEADGLLVWIPEAGYSIKQTNMGKPGVCTCKTSCEGLQNKTCKFDAILWR